MTTEWILNHILLFVSIVGGICAICWGWAKWVELLKVKVSEKSVGETKIKELERFDKKIQEDFDKLYNSDVRHDRDIETLKEDYKKIIFTVWDFIKK